MDRTGKRGGWEQQPSVGGGYWTVFYGRNKFIIPLGLKIMFTSTLNLTFSREGSKYLYWQAASSLKCVSLIDTTQWNDELLYAVRHSCKVHDAAVAYFTVFSRSVKEIEKNSSALAAAGIRSLDLPTQPLCQATARFFFFTTCAKLCVRGSHKYSLQTSTRY
jgi:hypothetical protein